MFRGRSSSMSIAKAARELERQVMTMEVVSGEEAAEPAAAQESSWSSSQRLDVALPDRLAFGPYGITPLRGLHFDNAHDTATS